MFQLSGPFCVPRGQQGAFEERCQTAVAVAVLFAAERGTGINAATLLSARPRASRQNRPFVNYQTDNNYKQPLKLLSEPSRAERASL